MDVSIFFFLLKRKFAEVLETRVEIMSDSLVFVVKNLKLKFVVKFRFLFYNSLKIKRILKSL
ncbi:hypothetical protein PNK_0257 [Candidatus Protochlamydia naegleriophila]|uniref:Uncharacterized protein n=1 Tax=Candidatus Protochlamydia naegleriophila TaxID=389348 RepID=A0A0U5JDQ3_9BACT|nr:hypothetical protein PNK_0257 [Candidatus Protochlamydia naegleriophila]